MDDLSNWKGCEPVGRTTMEGRFVKLEPFDAQRHGPELFEASTMRDADGRFQYLLEYPPATLQEYQPWLENAQASVDPIYYAVIDKASGKVAGRQTFLRTEAQYGVTEIGHIFWSAMIAKTPATTEAFYLFARHVFDDLGYRRFEWKCNNDNAPSKRAAIRYGMSAEGVHRQLMVAKGKNRDTAWFSMLDHEWPKCKAAFEAWLSAENFDEDGRQVRRLEDIRAEL